MDKNQVTGRNVAKGEASNEDRRLQGNFISGVQSPEKGEAFDVLAQSFEFFLQVQWSLSLQHFNIYFKTCEFFLDWYKQFSKSVFRIEDKENR